MAACTTVLDPSLIQRWPARIAERNAELMAQQIMRRRGVRTPEITFTRHFDNSRLVKASDPVRVRQMRVFSAAVTVLFTLIMVYGLQHFSAIEGSYRVESEKQMVDQLREENRQLRLAEAQLSQPGRIDPLAHQMGLAAPTPDQVVHSTAHPDSSSPVYAQYLPPSSLNLATQ
jgi:cell division protein FtsL